jgi:hypothetical protein
MYEYQLFKQEWLSGKHEKELRPVVLAAMVDFHLKNNSPDVALAPYNLLRETAGLKLALNAPIDKKWVDAYGYRSIKLYMQSNYMREQLRGKFGQELLAVRFLDQCHRNMQSSSKNSFLHHNFLQIKKYIYRYLCELEKKKPLAEHLITTRWIADTKKRIAKNFLNEKYKPLTGILLQHAHKIQRECNVQGEILYFQGTIPVTGVIDDIRYMTIMAHDHDPHPRNFGLYHEMGHIIHKDLTPQSYKKMLANPAFKKDLARMQRYLERGKRSIPKNTYLGTYLEQVKQKHPQLWVAPKDQDTYQKMLYQRGTEQRADLYAFDMIAKRRIFDVLISTLYYFGLSQSVVAYQAYNKHPSDIERAFCILGFLAEKGVNISALAQKFEQSQR